jgi:hypothetical protein
VGPPPAAALTLTTGLPGDSPAFPVRRTLRGCPVPRTTTNLSETWPLAHSYGPRPRPPCQRPRVLPLAGPCGNGPPSRIEVAARPQAAVTHATQGFRECRAPGLPVAHVP